MTECIPSRLAFASERKQEVIAEFNGGTISSDGGALLLREAGQRINLLGRFSQCFPDGRNPTLIGHCIEEMLA